MIDFNKPNEERPHPARTEKLKGTQKIWRFPNGYGASVVQFYGSYGYEEGKWELAVIKFEGKDIDDFSLTYDTEITSDVIGYLEPKEVVVILKKIEKLTKDN